MGELDGMWIISIKLFKKPSTGSSLVAQWFGLHASTAVKSESESDSVVSNSWWLHGLYSPWNSPSQNTGVGSLSLLQGIFPTQGWNPGLPYCRQILYQLSHRGSPGLWPQFNPWSGNSDPASCSTQPKKEKHWNYLPQLNPSTLINWKLITHPI